VRVEVERAEAMAAVERAVDWVEEVMVEAREVEKATEA
jgi:hypothetical protein